MCETIKLDGTTKNNLGIGTYCTIIWLMTMATFIMVYAIIVAYNCIKLHCAVILPV